MKPTLLKSLLPPFNLRYDAIQFGTWIPTRTVSTYICFLRLHPTVHLYICTKLSNNYPEQEGRTFLPKAGTFHPKRQQPLLWNVNPTPSFARDISAHAYPKFIPSKKITSLVISTVNTILCAL